MVIQKWSSYKKNIFLSFMPYPCSHFYFDIKFGDRLYSIASSLLNIICRQIWYQSKSDYMDRAYGSTSFQDFLYTFSMALYHKWDVKNDSAFMLQFVSLISDGLGGVQSISMYNIMIYSLPTICSKSLNSSPCEMCRAKFAFFRLATNLEWCIQSFLETLGW